MSNMNGNNPANPYPTEQSGNGYQATPPQQHTYAYQNPPPTYSPPPSPAAPQDARNILRQIGEDDMAKFQDLWLREQQAVRLEQLTEERERIKSKLAAISQVLSQTQAELADVDRRLASITEDEANDVD